MRHLQNRTRKRRGGARGGGGRVTVGGRAVPAGLPGGCGPGSTGSRGGVTRPHTAGGGGGGSQESDWKTPGARPPGAGPADRGRRDGQLVSGR